MNPLFAVLLEGLSQNGGWEQKQVDNMQREELRNKDGGR